MLPSDYFCLNQQVDFVLNVDFDEANLNNGSLINVKKVIEQRQIAFDDKRRLGLNIYDENVTKSEELLLILFVSMFISRNFMLTICMRCASRCFQKSLLFSIRSNKYMKDLNSKMESVIFSPRENQKFQKQIL